MIKITTLYTFVLLVISAAVHAQPLPQKFDSKGHPKAKGVWLTVRYPQGWSAREGERPNILQKFVGAYGGVDSLLMLQVRDGGTGSNIEKECSTLTDKDWVDIFTEPASSIEGMRKIQHEGKPGILFNVLNTQGRAGLILHSSYRVMAICHDRNLVLAWCGSVAPDGIKVKQNLHTLEPLCQQYFNSLVLMDRY